MANPTSAEITQAHAQLQRAVRAREARRAAASEDIRFVHERFDGETGFQVVGQRDPFAAESAAPPDAGEASG